jgi:hypothetical protein
MSSQQQNVIDLDFDDVYPEFVQFKKLHLRRDVDNA